MTTSLIHDADSPLTPSSSRLDAVIEDLRTKPVDAATLDRARTKARSAFYSYLEALGALAGRTCWGLLHSSTPIPPLTPAGGGIREGHPRAIMRPRKSICVPTRIEHLTIEPRKPTP